MVRFCPSQLLAPLRGDWHGLVLFQAVFLTEPSKCHLPKGQQDTVGLGKEVVGSGGCPGS